ncbi:O-antigen ligase family protein [Aneurinibacillus tyrosinisolvens]|uniref:O-antigen ligase family protein n=1 Tax=Aneurinibacillus tyrosinisolvens TaxID=1443435 RepID=UPI00063F448C|nr:O-antigen ligase family protein [Aneurinibacillus tyrosinisolvens]
MGLVQIYRVIRWRTPIDFTVGIFFFLSLLISSIAASIELHNITYLASLLLVIGYLGFYLYVKQHGTLYLFRNWIWISIGGGLYIALLGWMQILFHVGFSTNGIWGLLTGTRLFGYDQMDRLFGSTYNPNFASFLLLYALALLLVVWLYKIHQRKRRITALFIGCLLVLSTAIIETGSRTGFAAMILLFFFFFFRLRLKNGIFALIGFLVSCPLLMKWLPRSESLGESMSDRKLIWETSLSIWEKHPLFGVTPNGFQDIYKAVIGQYVAHPHNIFLYFFVSYGTMGGLAFLLMVAVLLYRLLLTLKANRIHKEFLDAFLFLVPVILITGLFDFPMFSPQTALLAVGLLGHWEFYSRRCSFVPLGWKKKAH